VIAVDLRGHRGLEGEALAELGALDQRREHDLERAAPPRLAIEHLVHGAHAAGRHAATDLVAAMKHRAGRELR
jgi:hypothetical protein